MIWNIKLDLQCRTIKCCFTLLLNKLHPLVSCNAEEEQFVTKQTRRYISMSCRRHNLLTSFFIVNTFIFILVVLKTEDDNNINKSSLDRPKILYKATEVSASIQNRRSLFNCSPWTLEGQNLRFLLLKKLILTYHSRTATIFEDIDTRTSHLGREV